MKDSKRNRNQRETILVIHQDVSVLVLVKGILAKDYRVLLAADAGSAERLAMLDAVPIDLALIGRNTPGVRNSRELQRRLLAIRPELHFMSMIGSAEGQVITIRMVGMPKAHRADDFLDQIGWALGTRAVNQAFAANDVHIGLSRERFKTASVPLVARAGAAT